ncbi:DUF7405 family protein [Halocatena halophila]|uniref:DUF7405 family protein n=1 Tax=Halocatena halophila TaxID=2814576 RepID=UPI002ED0B4B4
MDDGSSQPPECVDSISRRSFVRSAVAVGGTAVFAACLARERPQALPQGVTDPSTLPERQHAWNEALSKDDHGNVVVPRHRLLLYLDYRSEGVPTTDERSTVATALETLERAYPRSNEGLLFTVSYSPRYFERFDVSLPSSVSLPPPEALAPFESPTLDTPDAVVHLASDYGSVVLSAEQALFGELDALNGRGVDASIEGVFHRRERRTGFIGAGLPADNQSVAGLPASEPVSEETPLYMGFKSSFSKSQASEDRVTIDDGPFAGGTTQHISTLRLHLQQWYEQDSRRHRVATMFCPAHADEQRVEGVGENLGTDPEISAQGCPSNTQADWTERGRVGHAQKSARARRDDRPIILRRDFNSTDDDTAGLHFVSLQASIEDFVETRTAMNGTDLDGDGGSVQRSNNGILQYLTVRNRGNYLVPPRRHRVLPVPNPTHNAIE